MSNELASARHLGDTILKKNSTKGCTQELSDDTCLVTVHESFSGVQNRFAAQKMRRETDLMTSNWGCDQIALFGSDVRFRRSPHAPANRQRASALRD